jgi:NTE family protein
MTRTAFVLSGGGSLGAVQLGMISELIRSGIKPDLIIGVSAGAINGAFLAGDSSVANVERMEALWTRMTTRDVLGLSWRSALGFLGMRDHIANPRGLRSLLQRDLRYQRFDQTTVPLHLVCADLVTGNEVVISEGDVAEAVLASAAIPGVFPPVTYRGRQLIDGAVAAGTPISVAASLGVARAIVLPCGFACAMNTVPRHALGRAMHAVTLMGARQLRRDFEHFSKSMAMRLAPPLCPLKQSPYDYSNGAELIARGRASTRAWLEGGGLDSDAFPHQLTIHSHG